MGADLIVDYVCVKHKLTYSPDDKPFWDKLRIVWQKKLAASDHKQLFNDFEDETSTTMDVVEATALIEEMIDILEHNPRDVSWISIPGGVTVFLTGGMSHGDDPTDSYATFYKFNRLLPADYIDEVLNE